MRTMGVMLAAVISVGMWAQDPLTTLPQNYKVIFENAEVKVIRAHYGPHEKVPVHDHPGVATVFVYLNDSGKVRIDHDGDGAESVVRPPTVKGSYRVASALAERHSIENLGDRPSDFLRVELKRVNLVMKEPFRGKAPMSLVAGDEVEFGSSSVQIERTVCIGESPCVIKSLANPSLLIAFAPVTLLRSSGVAARLEDGSVEWLAASQTATIVSSGSQAVEILRVVLLTGK